MKYEKLMKLLALALRLTADIADLSEAVKDNKPRSIKDSLLTDIKDKSEFLNGVIRNL